MSRDPEDGNLKDPASLHKYLYANGDIINGIDPTGRDAVPEYIFDWKLEIKMLNWEAREKYLHFGFELVHAEHFAQDMGECDQAGLTLASNALASLTDAPQLPVKKKFPDCIPEALWTIMQPIPHVPFPPYPGP